jgi:predicted nucleic acid-binding protein
MINRAIVLDANILIRAVLGKRVRELFIEHASAVRFFAPDVAFADARKYLPELLEKRDIAGEAAMRVLDSLAAIVRTIDADFYLGMKQQALERIERRDADDWPILACAMIGLSGLDGRYRFLRHGCGNLDHRSCRTLL